MAYQTKSDEFFDFLQQMLAENQVNETVQLLSDATSVDPTLHGDLKFLKLRANKKLMVPAGMVGGPAKDQIRDVIKLLGELKKAHNRRKVMVSTVTEPSKKGVKALKKRFAAATPVATTSSYVKPTKPTSTTTTTSSVKTATTSTPLNPITAINDSSTKKKRAVWPWVLLLFLLGGGAAGYFFKDTILQNEYVQKVVPAGWLSEETPEDNSTPVKTTSNKKTDKKKTTSAVKPSKTSLGRWYIQIASYPTLAQALSKRKRIAMSFDRSVVLKKDIGGKENYRVVIPGFSDKKTAEIFKKERNVGKLHIGAFAQAFSRDCRDLKETDSNIFVCK